jgi:hypothetical protein
MKLPIRIIITWTKFFPNWRAHNRPPLHRSFPDAFRDKMQRLYKIQRLCRAIIRLPSPCSQAGSHPGNTVYDSRYRLINDNVQPRRDTSPAGVRDPACTHRDVHLRTSHSCWRTRLGERADRRGAGPLAGHCTDLAAPVRRSAWRSWLPLLPRRRTVLRPERMRQSPSPAGWHRGAARLWPVRWVVSAAEDRDG